MRTIFHIDANSAYLSWTAVDLLEKGGRLDLRTVPSAIAGDPENRHGIILTKSIPAKRFGIKTGESIVEARKKCPSLILHKPDYDLYMDMSKALYELLSEYSDVIERYSVDESWLDFTSSQKLMGDPVKNAYKIKDRIKDELGFTVNIGVSVNKLLSKMASELKKPDMVHSLFPAEIEEKMWPLPVSELFYVGRATARKLNSMGIKTIGDIARSEPAFLRSLLKPIHGQTVYDFAHGIDDTELNPARTTSRKGVGNGTTVAYDVTTEQEAFEVLLALSERVGLRLRQRNSFARVVAVSICSNEFSYYSHQVKLLSSICITSDIFTIACRLFREAWKGEKVRKLGIHLSDLSVDACRQYSFFDRKNLERLVECDKAIDAIRKKYGDRAIVRGVFVNNDIDPLQGGVNDGNYLSIGGYASS